MTIIAILTSIISGYYYIKVIKVIYFQGEWCRAANEVRGGISENYSIIIAMISLVIILFIVSPEWLYNSIQMIC